MITALLLLTGCAGVTTLNLGVGHNVNTSKGGIHGTNCNVSLRHTVNNVYVEYDHNSMCLRGAPFNNKKDFWADRVNIGYEIILRDQDG